MVIELTKQNFDEAINSNICTFIDFWADWCGPCRHFSKIYEEVSKKHPDIVFAKVNITNDPDLAKDFDVKSIPHLTIFIGNVIIYSHPGSLFVSELEKLIADTRELEIFKLQVKSNTTQSCSSEKKD